MFSQNIILPFLVLTTACISQVCCAKKKEAPPTLTTGEEVKTMHVDNKLTLKCSWPINIDSSPIVSWYKNEAPLSNPDDAEHYVISSKSEPPSESQKKKYGNDTVLVYSSTIVIEHAVLEDIGYYDCRALPPANASFDNTFLVTSISYDVVPKSTEVTEGYDLELSCSAKGDKYLQPVVNWFKDDEPIEEAVDTDRLVVYPNADGLENAALNITEANQEDRGLYSCVIDYKTFRTYNTSTYVRVKDPLRVLWPVIGIVVQIIVLLATIFACEKMRTKEGDDDTNDITGLATTCTEPN